MAKRVLCVGQCQPDHGAIRALLTSHFEVELDQAHGRDDTLAALRGGHYDLVLVNRKLDRDYSDGIEIIRTIKADLDLADVPVMLVTNYPEHQDAAVAAGAERGFGKQQFDRPETTARLAPILGKGKESSR